MSIAGTNHILDLPPGFSAVGLREHRDAFKHAQVIAAEQGAGTLVWVRRFDTVEAAVVLEPDCEAARARLALYAGMNAIADALALHCPPEKPLTFGWPDTLLLDGGIIGGCRLAVSDGRDADGVPDWQVLGFVVRNVVQTTVDHVFQRGTSLEAEGLEMMDGDRLIESFARHLLYQFDRWRSVGAQAVAAAFLSRMPPRKGVRLSIDDNGDLLERRLPALKDVIRQPLTAALARPQWLDPTTDAPWM